MPLNCMGCLRPEDEGGKMKRKAHTSDVVPDFSHISHGEQED